MKVRIKTLEALINDSDIIHNKQDHAFTSIKFKDANRKHFIKFIGEIIITSDTVSICNENCIIYNHNGYNIPEWTIEEIIKE